MLHNAFAMDGKNEQTFPALWHRIVRGIKNKCVNPEVMVLKACNFSLKKFASLCLS